MKVIDRHELMSLPSGTVYAKGGECYFTSLEVKGETIKHQGKDADFFSRNLMWPNGCQNEVYDTFFTKRLSFPINETEGRDGCYDDDDLFMVYEAGDLKSLSAVILNAMQLTEEIDR